MKRHPDEIARQQHLNEKQREWESKKMENPPWVKSKNSVEKVRVYSNGMTETQDGSVSLKGYTSPPFPIWADDSKVVEPIITSYPPGMVPWQGMPIKIKKLTKNAIVPTKANKSDAGCDLYANRHYQIPSLEWVAVKTGIAIAIPDGYVGLIWPRSGLALKHGIDVFAGVIDSGYRGEIAAILFNAGDECVEIIEGERIAQILFQKIENFDFIEVEKLEDSERGKGGFGSSGK